MVHRDVAERLGRAAVSAGQSVSCYAEHFLAAEAGVFLSDEV